MTRLQDMQITEKINALQSLIAKAELDVEYSIQVRWGDNKEQTINEAKTFINNARLLFQNGKIDQLDYDMKQEAFAHYHTKLDSYLKMFPEFELNDIQTESVTTGSGGRHM